MIPHASLCADCQKAEDVFKYRMKIVGFNEEPTIARNKKDWDILKKQRAVKDI